MLDSAWLSPTKPGIAQESRFLFARSNSCFLIIPNYIDNPLYKRKASAIDLNGVWFDSDGQSNFADAEQPLFKARSLKSHIFSTFHPA
jgi:hypothetical protein